VRVFVLMALALVCIQSEAQNWRSTEVYAPTQVLRCSKSLQEDTYSALVPDVFWVELNTREKVVDVLYPNQRFFGAKRFRGDYPVFEQVGEERDPSGERISHYKFEMEFYGHNSAVEIWTVSFWSKRCGQSGEVQID